MCMVLLFCECYFLIFIIAILYQWLDLRADQLNGLHQFFMWHFGSIHLESKPANSFECIGMAQNFCSYFFRATNKQRAFLSWAASHVLCQPWSWPRHNPDKIHPTPAG